MPDDKKPANSPAKKRTVLTDEERIAKAEQELADIRAKVQEKAKAKITQLREKVAKATEANRKTEARLAEAKRELEAAEKAAAPQPATPRPAEAKSA